MKALTLHQPWASFVAIGAKEIETRSWGTDYRGSLAIHASKSLPLQARQALVTFERILDEYGLEPMELPMGALIATAELVDVLPAIQIEGDVVARERSLGNFSPGRFAWVLADTKLLDQPIPYRGFQRLWDLPDEVLS